jgi:hypothetical protein
VESGYYQNTVTDEKLSAACAAIQSETDKETVLVYTLRVAGWHAGKGGTERGRKAAANILKDLPREMVSRRVLQLQQDCPDYMKSEIEWVIRFLNIPMTKTESSGSANSFGSWLTTDVRQQS